jgi:DNA polymerase-3 subunit delta'
MQERDIIGLDHLKKHLQTTVDRNRIAHAQLFVGSNGSGILSLALFYARMILCSGSDEGCQQRMDQLAHPDLHFAFPVGTTSRVTSKPVSDDFIAQWRSFLSSQPYGVMEDWLQHAEIEKKSCEIRVHEAALISKKLSLKSYEGGSKVCIIYGADLMNVAASNKLLKLIEEPPNGTVLILIAEDENRILNTIKSRCQILHVPRLSAANIAESLEKQENASASKSQMIARQANGNYNKALKLLHNNTEDEQFEKWFIHWVRTAFSAKAKPSAIKDLIVWAETIAATNREVQKRFLHYCMEFFRQAMLVNYKATAAVYLQPDSNFDLKKFAPFIDGHRLVELEKSISEAQLHIERNANAKIVFTDLSIGLTRILHKPSES